MGFRSRLVLLFIACVLGASGASATVVERVVAVVGERAILLSDLRLRARPMLVKIQAEVPPGAQRAAAISQTYKQVLERMVDEELEQRAANRSHVVVSAQEVDEAIGRIASQNNISVDQLVSEATRAGLTERQYRNEIRRQVLEAKLMNLRLQGRIRITEEDLQSAYRRLVVEERRKLHYRAAWIKIDIEGSARDAAARTRGQAESIAEQARRGTDFAVLAQQYSDDSSTRERGGLLGRLTPGMLPRPVDQAAMGLEVGEISTPVRFAKAFYVLKLIERQESELPSFVESKAELGERQYLERMGKARRHWLDGLRRQTHVEIRL